MGAWSESTTCGELVPRNWPAVVRVGMGLLCFYFCAIVLLSIMLSEITILERDYATYMLA